MQEALLQYIWQHSLFQPQELHTSEGETVDVIHPGRLNRDSGPDFSMAKIRLGGLILYQLDI
jgi:hypothetical protein